VEAGRLEGILTLVLVLASLATLPASVLNVPETAGTSETADAEGWLPGWRYRRAVIIDNTANPSTLADYQVLVVVDTATLISEGKMVYDCRDIRFTDEDGVTIIPHWVERATCNTSSTRIWIRVPSIPGGSAKTVYMYYGNILATSTSNSTAVWGKHVRFTYGRDGYYVALILSAREWASPTSETLIPGTRGNDVGASVTLPRSVTIYGTTVTAVYVTSNGFIRWDNVRDNRAYCADIANKIIAPHWEDLRTETTFRPDGGVYLIQGSDYYGDYFGFRWRAVYYYYTEDRADFEVLFYSNNAIQFNFYTLSVDAYPCEFISAGDGSNYIDLTPRWRYMESVLFVPRARPEPAVSVAPGEEGRFIPLPNWLPGWNFRVPVIITASTRVPAGYQVRIVVDTASLIRAGKMRPDGADIRFTADDGVTPIPHWVEPGTINTTSTSIWVRMPVSIPAGQSIRIYMYYGNPHADSTSDSLAVWGKDVSFVYGRDDYYVALILADREWIEPITEYTVGFQDEYGVSVNIENLLGRPVTIYGVPVSAVFFCSNGYIRWDNVGDVDPNSRLDPLKKIIAPHWEDLEAFMYYGTCRDDHLGDCVFFAWWGYYYGLGMTTHFQLVIYASNAIQFNYLYLGYPPLINPVAYISAGDGRNYIDLTPRWELMESVLFIHRVVPEPVVTLGAESSVAIPQVSLPGTSVLFRHALVYSPDSTQFAHSFTATYTGTAGYETGYGGDRWAWRVFANPYSAGENTASLVSTVTITLPYATVLVEKLELYARTAGTGSYRRLWIRVLDSTGSLVAEVSNATMGTGWALTAISVNRLLSGSVTVWINATVTSTTSVGEEICVSGVKLYMSHNTTTDTVVTLDKRDRLNATTVFTVNLDTTLVNSSIIDLLIIDKLAYDSTNYPAVPIYVGNETVGSNNYLVYRIAGATSTGTFWIRTTMQNAITRITFRSRGVEVSRVLVGEPFTVEIPVVGNISIPDLRLEYANTRSATVAINVPGTYTVIANATRPGEYVVGYREGTIIVDYGVLIVKFSDLDGEPVDYEALDLTLRNMYTRESRSARAGALAILTGLKYGVHELVAGVKGVPACRGVFDLYSATNASVLSITCNIKRVQDYRGLNKSVMFDFGKRLLSLEDLSPEHPYSRIRILLSGTGAFALVLNYHGKKPTSVSVVANVAITRWYWDDHYLVVTGILHGMGEIIVTDLYRLRVEVYDRLGNLIPLKVPLYINGTTYYTPVAEGLFCPETYIVILPAEIYGFKFHSFGDGYGDTVRLVNISTSDVVLRAYYRVPSRIEVKAYRVSSLAGAAKSLLLGDGNASVYFEGRLLDYYGNGVPGRAITVRLYRAGSLVAEYNVTTDPSGYWRTPLLELARGEKYAVSVHYAGDDTYVESATVYEFGTEALPPAPAPAIPPVEALAVVTGVLLVVGLILVATRAVKHTVTELERERRFVKRKTR
jgi:hypothetical protein